MLLGEPRGRPKCLKKIIGTAAFVRIEIMRRPSSVPCAMSEKVNGFINFKLTSIFMPFETCCVGAY